MKHDVSVHINDNDLKVIVLNGDLTIAMKHQGNTFIGARVALFLGVVDTKTLRKYFDAVKQPKASWVTTPVFGQIAEVRSIDYWKHRNYLQLFSALRSMLGKGFTDAHAFRIIEAVTIGQFSFSETDLQELGYRMAVMRMNEIIRAQPMPATPRPSQPRQPHGQFTSSDDGQESQRSTNALMSSMFASPISASYMDSCDSSSSDSGGACSSD